MNRLGLDRLLDWTAVALMVVGVVAVTVMLVAFVVDLSTNGLEDKRCEGTTLVYDSGVSLPDDPRCRDGAR